MTKAPSPTEVRRTEPLAGIPDHSHAQVVELNPGYPIRPATGLAWVN